MKFFIKTFGCQYNEWDAARLSFVLENLGLKETSKESANVIFIMNCSVRKTAVDRAMSWSKNLISPDKTIIVCGCILPADKGNFLNKGARIWNGSDLTVLADLISIDRNEDALNKLFKASQKTSNLIPIMKGCNNFCSYCAVPYTRGREVSRPFEQVLDDVKKVINSGHKEIWLLGQNVNSYNPNVISTHPEPTSGWIEGGEKSHNKAKKPFAVLLEQINNIEGDFTVFFTSNHPKDMTDDIIDTIKNCNKVAKIIHLPLQSGSNKILKAMNRPYSKEQYLELVSRIQSEIPDVKITTDTIVGFPGETEEDFQETMELFKRVKFFQAYNNKYSPRSGTVAFKLGDPISWSEKQRRWKALNDLIGDKYKK